jgi:hypothetical protein
MHGDDLHDLNPVGSQHCTPCRQQSP